MAKKILVVDDEPEIVGLIEIRLKHWGYDVVTAYDAEKCFQVIEKEHPDLILLDIVMPGMDGITACNRIRTTYNIPVIIVTALHDYETMHDASMFGAFDYIAKPIDDEKLKSKIEKALT